MIRQDYTLMLMVWLLILKVRQTRDCWYFFRFFIIRKAQGMIAKRKALLFPFVPDI